MDVLCVGMYRACSTWQYEVVAHLVERYREGTRLGYVQPLSYRVPGGFSTTTDSWRVLKSHEGGPYFARALSQGKALAVYAMRDARDVVYSMLHKRNQRFDEFLRQGMIHQIVANHRFWMSRPRGTTLVQRYEELVREPAKGVREIAAFLGLAVSAAESQEIAGQYSFEANKQRAEMAALRLIESGVDLRDPSNSTCYDGQSLLHWNHLRQGRSGSWLDEANPRQRAVLQRVLGAWLAEYGYAPDSEAKREHRHNHKALRDEITMLRGWMACRLRCAALRFPRVGALAKRVLRLRTADEAKPIERAIEAVRARSATQADAPESAAA